MQITVKTVDKAHFSDAKSVRMTVFCDEQGFSPEIELDEHDMFTDDTVHFAAYCDETAVGAGRIIFGSADFPCKIGRVAVLKKYRKYGIGRKLIFAMIDYAQSRQVHEIVVDSQLSAMGFYAKCGFTPFGDEHPDGHIMHKYMRLTL